MAQTSCSRIVILPNCECRVVVVVGGGPIEEINQKQAKVGFLIIIFDSQNHCVVRRIDANN